MNEWVQCIGGMIMTRQNRSGTGGKTPVSAQLGRLQMNLAGTEAGHLRWERKRHYLIPQDRVIAVWPLHQAWTKQHALRVSRSPSFTFSCFNAPWPEYTYALFYVCLLHALSCNALCQFTPIFNVRYPTSNLTACSCFIFIYFSLFF